MRFSNRMRLLAAAALGIVADVFAMGEMRTRRACSRLTWLPSRAHPGTFSLYPRWTEP